MTGLSAAQQLELPAPHPSMETTVSGIIIESHSKASMRSAMEPPRKQILPPTRTNRASPKVATTSSVLSVTSSFVRFFMHEA